MNRVGFNNYGVDEMKFEVTEGQTRGKTVGVIADGHLYLKSNLKSDSSAFGCESKATISLAGDEAFNPQDITASTGRELYKYLKIDMTQEIRRGDKITITF